MSTRFKICGVRRPEDVEASIAAGAAAIGLNLYRPSSRCVTIPEAARLAAMVPAGVEVVMLAVQLTASAAAEAAMRVGASTIQWHGDLSQAEREVMAGFRIILARPTDPGRTLQRLAPARALVDAVLLDALVPGQRGGTGRVADWGEARSVREALGDVPLILAGGLTPENVGDAIAAVRPAMVDVASGVEGEPGVKDAERIAAFGAAVRRAG